LRARATFTLARARSLRVVGGECLPQAVALTALLSRAGSDPALVIGSRRYAQGVWGAHAWVEVGGVRLDVVPSEEHRELTRFRAASQWQAARGNSSCELS